MNPQSTDRIVELQAQLAACDELRQQLREARESLDRETYRLDTIEISLDLAQADIRELESLSLAGIMSSLLGTKAGRIDARREECETLEREHRECARAIETLKQQVAQRAAEIAGFAEPEAELQSLTAASALPGEADAPSADADAPPAASGDPHRSIERALEAGESLLNHLDGMFRLCTRLRSGPSRCRGAGALVTAAMRAYKSNVASGVTAQIAGSARHFRNRLGELDLRSERPADAEILAVLPQLARFADPAAPGLGNEVDSWAELEALTRGLVSDLQERLHHSSDHPG